LYSPDGITIFSGGLRSLIASGCDVDVDLLTGTVATERAARARGRGTKK